jgi:alanine racemase
MAEPEPARLTIDLDALAANLSVLRQESGAAEVAAVVKSEGYGLGGLAMARRLWAEGVRSFFVARLAEGEALRRGLGAERACVIYVLDGLTANSAARLAAADLTPVINSADQLPAARAFGRPLALHVDTGMNRQGLTMDEARAVTPADFPITLVMSHLGSASEPADPRNALQLERFLAIRSRFPEARASLAASAGVFLGPAYHFDMVRPGISLYGGGPRERPDPRFRPVACLTAPVLDIRAVGAGERIGYGSGAITERPTRIALVGAGYADGVIRGAKGRGYAWAANARRPLVLVNMDILAIDIGEAPLRVGDPVELLGPNVPLDDLAQAAGTVAHEVLVRLSTRAERRYLGKTG